MINRKGVILQAFITTANKDVGRTQEAFSLPISDGCVRHAIADSGYNAEDNYKTMKENSRNKKGNTPPGGEYRSKALRFSQTKRGGRAPLQEAHHCGAGDWAVEGSVPLGGHPLLGQRAQGCQVVGAVADFGLHGCPV